MKTKEIHEFLIELCKTLQKRVDGYEKTKYDPAIKEYANGQFYEATYILENIEKIIYKD